MINKEINMPYYELCEYLKIKYGSAICDYFPNPECKAKRAKVSRSSEGLYCHHIDEDKGSDLSHSVSARRQPFLWQKAERLVYCNSIEHLILHIKIAIMRQKSVIVSPTSLGGFFTTGGILLICGEINSLYFDKGGKKEYHNRCYDVIKDDLESYIDILNFLFCYLDSLYVGARDPRTEIPLNVLHSLPDETIEERMKKIELATKLSFSDYMEHYRIVLSSTFYGDTLTCIYEKLQTASFDNRVQIGRKVLSIDFKGYGFPQFNRFFMNVEKWGAQSLDEYISKAFPSKNTSDTIISNEIPKFWQGELAKEKFDRLIHDNAVFFVVRIKTSFDLLPNCTSFIYDRQVLNTEIDDDNNFLIRKGKIVHSCIHPITVTLTKDDFLLFKKTYHIKSLLFLDGCYWE